VHIRIRRFYEQRVQLTVLRYIRLLNCDAMRHTEIFHLPVWDEHTGSIRSRYYLFSKRRVNS